MHETVAAIWPHFKQEINLLSLTSKSTLSRLTETKVSAESPQWLALHVVLKYTYFLCWPVLHYSRKYISGGNVGHMEDD